MDEGARWASALLALVLIAAIVASGVDLLVFNRRLRQGDAFSVVNVRKFSAVSDGHGRYHFVYVGRVDESCARALLRHQGDWPCWWMRLERDGWTR